MKIQNSLLFLAVLLFISYFLYLPTPSYALDTPNTATISADIKEKLKALQEEIASRAAQLKQEISKKLQDRAYVGFIKAKSDNSLTLATDTGSKSATINEFTDYIGKGKVNFKALAVGDYIAALGDIDDNDLLTAKRIVKLTPPEENRQTIFGEVSAINKKSVTIKTKDSQNLDLSFDPDADYQLGDNDSSFNAIKINQPIVVVATTAKNGELNVRFVYMFPGENQAKAASPSATPTKAPNNKG